MQYMVAMKKDCPLNWRQKKLTGSYFVIFFIFFKCQYYMFTEPPTVAVEVKSFKSIAWYLFFVILSSLYTLNLKKGF